MNELLSRVSAMIDQALEVDFSIPSDTGHIDLDADVAETIAGLVAAAVTLLEAIEQEFDAEGDSEGVPPETGEVSVLRAIGAEISSALAQQELADLAFVGRHQLSEIRRQIVSARAAKSTWKILAHCETALRRVRKALVACESALREYGGLPMIPRDWESLSDALEIRRIYGQFRRSVTRLGLPEEARLAEELARVARRIAILRDRAIYPYLRIEDRREIRRCQKRIEAWLAADDGSRALAERGSQLWQDLVGFANLLAQVSNRQSLRAHDRDVVAKALRIVGRRGAAPDAMPADVLEELQTLLGRDDELDDLLHDPAASERADAWRLPLRRLLAELDQSYRTT